MEQSSGATDPRACSEARRRGARFGKRIGECNGVPTAERGHRETRQSDNVLDPAEQRVCALGYTGTLGQGCAERVQTIGTAPQQKGATKTQPTTHWIRIAITNLASRPR